MAPECPVTCRDSSESQGAPLETCHSPSSPEGRMSRVQAAGSRPPLPSGPSDLCPHQCLPARYRDVAEERVPLGPCLEGGSTCSTWPPTRGGAGGWAAQPGPVRNAGRKSRGRPGGHIHPAAPAPVCASRGRCPNESTCPVFTFLGEK